MPAPSETGGRMALYSIKPPILRSVRGPARALLRAAAFCKTIRGRILVAFLIMSLITAALGYYATLGIRDDGVLVRKTYDQSLMAINYARAAATDFTAMRAAFARRWISQDPEVRADLDKKIEVLAKSLREDLAIAVQRAQSDRARGAAANVKRAANAWKRISERLLDKTKLDATWELLDKYSDKVDEQIDLLVNYTAGDGFLYRESASAAIARDMHLNIVGTILALLLSGAVTWTLARHIIKPVATASEVANCVATGKLDVVIPSGGMDELGALLGSMQVMRDNIKAMMAREVGQRRSAQSRLADALEGSQEGIVVIDAQDRIALANAQAIKFLNFAPEIFTPGTPLSELRAALAQTARDDRVLNRNSANLPTTGEFELADGRWLRFSQSATRDQGLIVVFSDVTLVRQQKANLRAINLRLDAALENMSQGLCLFDGQDRLEVVNRRFLDIFGLSRENIEPGVSFSKILALSEARSNHDCTLVAEVLTDQQTCMSRHEIRTHYYELGDGRIIASVYSPSSNGGWVATFEDVTERRRAEAQIMHMARHDTLTDLPNRALFREKMEQALAQNEKFAIHFIDLDRFKTVNDTLGHTVGDALLCAVTKRLQMAVRGADTVARLGGDEFAIIQVGAKPADASDLAVRLIELMSEPFDTVGNHIVVGVSVGIAMAPTDGNNPDQLLRNSDMALYRAKSAGRGSYHFFEAEMDAKMQARHALEIDLRKAMSAREFEVHYQPIVDLAKNEYVGLEALARWNHPRHGRVAPDEFIPIAEEIGLIVPFGDWLLKQACHEATNWPSGITIAVNLSAVQFRSATLIYSIASALATSGLSPSRLELEITETVLLQHDQTILTTLHQIKDLGVQISMDDFGTGYSSLSYLRSFPFDKIKIDRSFTKELGKRADCMAIVRAMTRLGSSLGMTTIAEGVETKAQLEILRGEGCDQVQGFLFSPPVPAKDVPTLFRTRPTHVRAA
jgi:diguanylate cyclase (GGDEF)-like protein/PAS domain S-box-containing protein